MYPVNYLAVLVAAIVSMIVGGLWYSPLLFANIWMKELGKTEKDKSQMQKEAPKAMAGMFIGSLVMAYVLAVFAYPLITFVDGMLLGFWMWLGFVMPAYLAMTLFESRKWSLFFISTGYYLVILVITGGILAAWN